MQADFEGQQLAARAFDHKEHEPDLRVADLFAPSWYHSARLPVYTFGGAFVDFLLRRFGTRPFVDLYNRCQTNTFESDILDIYGRTLTELESEFWDDARKQAQDRTRR